ncbi:beta-lactamase-like protein [Mycena crocata]|nr:beta-lactamase-like protein [Mycena crocata]
MAVWTLLVFFVLRCTAFTGIPSSTATVDVKVFNVVNFTSTAAVLLQPVLPGHESIPFPAHAFLVEHPAAKKRLMFDLGLRSDPLNLVPSIASGFASGEYHVDPFKGITELLEDGGISLDTIDAVVWSHSHFDHIGDMSKFPNSTKLVIGPATNRSTYPEFPDAELQDSDLAGHEIIELNFDHANLTFSGLPALDYFGDGSFYLLNTPGHRIGHITALARVTPSSFLVLGGDTGHHVGLLRPRPEFQRTYPCPAHLLAESRASVSTQYFWSPGSDPSRFDIHSRDQPLLSIPDKPNTVHADPVAARVTLDKLAAFDADEDFLVILSHDESLINILPYFPASLSPWRANGMKDEAVWGFMDERNPAFRFNPQVLNTSTPVQSLWRVAGV